MAKARVERLLGSAHARAWGARLGFALAIVAGLATVPYAIADRGSASRVKALKEELAQTRNEIASLEKQNAALVRDITALKRHPGKIADIAREKLQMAGPDELVIAIVGDSK